MWFRRGLQAALIALLVVGGILLIDAPLHTHPGNRLTATRLALTIARAANCDNFKYFSTLDQGGDHFSMFYCQTEMIDIADLGKGGIFRLLIFYDTGTKKKIISELGSREVLTAGVHKTGSFYLISKFADISKIPAEKTKPEDYQGFPGEIITPVKPNITPSANQ
jgi:hypothetical protein